MAIILGLLGGLSLFLYGMQMMSGGLEAVAGDRLKNILEKLTTNRLIGILVGCIITMIIQSSSATTVMAVGFVNAQMMTLRQAVWVIMGANIGTTITGQLIALDIGVIAPVFAFLGVAFLMILKEPKKQQMAQIIAGLGILFLGMNLMSDAMSPLRNMPQFTDLVTRFSNPLVGIAVGAGFTALIQSSSASVGVMQALAMSGVVDLHTAVFVLFGQNIGTCITAILASIGSSREAKQATMIHLLFNTIGTISFTVICVTTPLTDFVMSWTPLNASQQIANMHTLFNVCTTLALIPFGTQLANIAEHILPSKSEEASMSLKYLEVMNLRNRMGTGAINVHQVHDEIIHMMDLAYKNVQDAFQQLLDYTLNRHHQIVKTENMVDSLNEEISKYITTALSGGNINANTSQALSAYYLMLVDLERISDYAVNISHQAQKGIQQNLGTEDLDMIRQMITVTIQGKEAVHDINAVYQNTQKAVRLTHGWRKKQIAAIKNNRLDSTAGIMMSRIFNDFLRINAHTENIGDAFNSIEMDLQENRYE